MPRRLAGLGSWEMDEESGAADVSEGLNALLGFPAIRSSTSQGSSSTWCLRTASS